MVVLAILLGGSWWYFLGGVPLVVLLGGLPQGTPLSLKVFIIVVFPEVQRHYVL